MMEQFREIIELEERRLDRIVGEMRETLAAEELDRQKKDRELAELKRQKLDAVGWSEKREIDEEIERCRSRYAMRRYQNTRVLNLPYFGILEMEDDDLGKLGYCLGRQSFFDRQGRAIVIDWREAPISRLYYEYEAGELYDEEIRGRDRSGTVRCKRQLDAAGAELRKIMEKDVLLTRDDDGAWRLAGEKGAIVSRREEKADHRLPEITALISPDQFRAITRPESSTVVLQGGAGSGKTTVGLHRIAYLTYREPGHFRPERVLVVMFNRALQHYISRVLPELGVGAGVHVETYHGWAGKLFRAAGLNVSFSPDSAPPTVMRIKKHALVLELVDRYLDGLLVKSRNWLLEQLARSGDPERDRIGNNLEALSKIEDLMRMLDTHSDFHRDVRYEARKAAAAKLLRRLNNHTADLRAVLTDRDLIESVFGPAASLPKGTINRLSKRQESLYGRNLIDFADTGILLWLMQRKGLARPGYAHLMVDEAQDLSEVEIATLLHAADERQSITICGDMAQKIKDDVCFASNEGFAGFVLAQQQRIGSHVMCSDTLEVGFRATRPIMELAWRVLGRKPAMSVPRDGDPVQIIRTGDSGETISKAKGILEAYVRQRPKALIAVVCRLKTDADRVFRELKLAGVAHLRRHERDDFSFEPGIAVTNAHQVKGLEFTAVMIINPGADQYRDNHENRMLLHVVITRAADHLWIIGHQRMAYGLDSSETGDR